MLYNFKKNIVKNENNLYSLTIQIPKNLENIHYKIYTKKFIIQSGYIENSKTINKINLILENLETIFILINNNNIEYFELVNLKDLYTHIIENIKINFKKNNNKMNHNLFNNYCELLKLNQDNDDSSEDEDDDDDNDDENQIEEEENNEIINQEDELDDEEEQDSTDEKLNE